MSGADVPNKVCQKCGEAKPITAFSVHTATRPTGARKARCRACDAATQREYRARIGPQTYSDREFARRQKTREREAARKRRYLQQNKAHVKAAQALKQRTPIGRARIAVQTAVRRGLIVKPSVCQDCGAETERRRLHGHHEDYTKPLAVEWLCVMCHGQRHRYGGSMAGVKSDGR